MNKTFETIGNIEKRTMDTMDKITSLNGRVPRPLRRFFRYNLAGTTGAVVDFGVLILLVEVFRMYYLNAAAISFILGGIFAYTINKRWGFRKSKRGYVRGLILFISFSALCGFLTIISLKFVVENYQVNYIIAKAIIFVIISTLNFILNYFITFRIKD